MQLTPQNLESLTIGQEIFVPKAFRIQERYTYMGIAKERLRGEYYIFSETNGNGFSIFKKYPETNQNLQSCIYNTYEESCVRMRELCLDIIDHFNKHQLKDNPIIVLAEVLEIAK